MEEYGLTLRERLRSRKCKCVAYYSAVFFGFLCIVSCFILAALTYAIFKDCEDCDSGSTKRIMVKCFRILATVLFLVGVLAIALSLCCRRGDSTRGTLPTVISVIPDSSLEKTPVPSQLYCPVSHRHPNSPAVSGSPLLLPRHDFIDADIPSYDELNGEITPPPTYEQAILLQWETICVQEDSKDSERMPLSIETKLWAWNFRFSSELLFESSSSWNTQQINQEEMQLYLFPCTGDAIFFIPPDPLVKTFFVMFIACQQLWGQKKNGKGERIVVPWCLRWHWNTLKLMTAWDVEIWEFKKGRRAFSKGCL